MDDSAFAVDTGIDLRGVPGDAHVAGTIGPVEHIVDKIVRQNGSLTMPLDLQAAAQVGYTESIPYDR